MFGKIILLLTGGIFAAYGIACIIDPSLPAEYMGVELGAAGGTVEFMAMYGGLQTAMGLLFLYTGLHAERNLAGLKVMALLLGGLGLTRLCGLILHGQDSYNMGAVVYEITSMVLALVALKLAASAAPSARGT